MSDKPIPERWRASYESGSSHALCHHQKNQVIEELGAAEAALTAMTEDRDLWKDNYIKSRKMLQSNNKLLRQQVAQQAATMSDAQRKLKLEESEHMLACQVAEAAEAALSEARQERDQALDERDAKRDELNKHGQWATEQIAAERKLWCEVAAQLGLSQQQVTQQAATLSEARARIKWLEAHGNHFRNPDTGQIECSCCETNGQLVDELRNEITMYRRYGGIE